MSQRDCRYAPDATPSGTTPTSENTSRDPSRSPGHDLKVGPDSAQSVIHPTTEHTASVASPPTSANNGDQQQSGFDTSIDLAHMELLIHLTTDPTIFSLGDNVGDFHTGMDKALKRALESPYLMYQLLAFSARHLAFLRPGRSAEYLHKAISLQTRAVSLFNATARIEEVDQSNCVPILLFSVILGHHLLADVWVKRDAGGLDAFISNTLQCMDVQRGVFIVVRTAWPILLETELEETLSWSASFTRRAPAGNQCQALVGLIDSSEGLSENDKQACWTAIRYLQVGFDGILAGNQEEKGNPFQMLFSWTMLLTNEFANLLSGLRPEALIVLAYYTVLLHHGRHMWQVGDVGGYIMGLICERLGPEWQPWLEHPRDMMIHDILPGSGTNCTVDQAS